MNESTTPSVRAQALIQMARDVGLPTDAGVDEDGRDMVRVRAGLLHDEDDLVIAWSTRGTTCHVVKDGAKVLVPARHAASHITELADLADVRAAFANQYGPDYMERIADDLQRFTR